MRFYQINNSSRYFDVEARVQEIPQNLRLKFAFKKFALFFSLAVLSIAVPVFHFVLVPLFLVISIGVFFKTLKLKYEMITDQSLHCLECNTELKFKKAEDQDFRCECSKCYTRYKKQ